MFTKLFWGAQNFLVFKMIFTYVESKYKFVQRFKMDFRVKCLSSIFIKLDKLNVSLQKKVEIFFYKKIQTREIKVNKLN